MFSAISSAKGLSTIENLVSVLSVQRWKLIALSVTRTHMHAYNNIQEHTHKQITYAQLYTKKETEKTHSSIKLPPLFPSKCHTNALYYF